MKVEILGCSGSRWKGGHTTAFLIDGVLLLDAGTATEVLDRERLEGIRDIALTHAHLDHICNLAFMADLARASLDSSWNIYCTTHTLDALRSHIFNNVIWPDFAALPETGRAKIGFNVVEELKDFEAGRYTLTPVPVNHSIPTVGYLVDDGESALAFAADTTSTELFWKALETRSRVKSLIVEASFPNRLEQAARLSGHLTPALLEGELEKLDSGDMDIYVTHIKPQNRGEVLAELRDLSSRIPLRVLRDGMTIEL